MKQILIIILCMSAFVVSKAQVSYGVKGGLNIPKITGSDRQDTEGKVGFYGGLFVGFPVADKLTVQPELVYSVQGVKLKYQDLESDLNTSFVNIPVLAKYTTVSGFYGETGPQLGILGVAHAKHNGKVANVRNQYKFTDFSWVFGFGYQKKSSNIGVDLRYNLGLNEIRESSNERNGELQLGVFYVLKTSKKPTKPR